MHCWMLFVIRIKQLNLGDRTLIARTRIDFSPFEGYRDSAGFTSPEASQLKRNISQHSIAYDTNNPHFSCNDNIELASEPSEESLDICSDLNCDEVRKLLMRYVDNFLYKERVSIKMVQEFHEEVPEDNDV